MKYIFIIFTLFIFIGFSNAQDFNDNFKPYNKNRITPFLTKWNEINAYSVLTLDLNYKDSEKGNLANGINYGFGLGYMFNIGLDNRSQKIGIGINAEVHPKSYFKYSIGLNHKILSYGKEDINASAFGSSEYNIVFNTLHQHPQMNIIFYLLEIQYKHFDFKWGLQSYWDRYIKTSYIDNSFNIIKASYKLDFK